jgi:hypothetical protein
MAGKALELLSSRGEVTTVGVEKPHQVVERPVLQHEEHGVID